MSGWDIVRVGLCQIPVGPEKERNLATARAALERAKAGGAQLAMLPECFNCPYDNACFREYAEIIPEVGEEVDPVRTPTIHMLSEVAKELGIVVIGGSIPELEDGDGEPQPVFNTSVTVGPTGTLLAKHRKIHLFDIDVPGGIRFMESETLSPGNRITTFQMPESLGSLRVGVGICYDMRFPELSMVMSREMGCELLCFPGAFNMTTGPAHWELLLRARALDNQVYVAACSPARDELGSYRAWGHSSVVSPWGEVVATTEHGPDIIFADLDAARLGQVRRSIPTGAQRRADVYLTQLAKTPGS
eukprot:CAMPEP_0184684004 /NCGR_PEP_ID=MMETSP0312-20130426/13502_1 /TAXON_ID=31354 /ORGANISM="Compsopogon coeruleus, Strain SAG 36.94" /LENGTH=302 /DNA_ID=CAMNT_0027136787 /DNA_START=1243 /DNA_END=2151 /DNA_ORIENTATION=-